MLPIYILWALTIYFILKNFSARKKFTYNVIQRKNRKIIFFGSLAFFFGLLGQIISLLDAFKILEKMETISVGFLLEGIWVSFLAPMYGFVLFLTSMIFYFSLKKNLRK